MKELIEKSNKNVKDLVFYVIKQITEQKFNASDVDVHEVDTSVLKFSEQMALILLNGPKLRMFFKFHFAISEVKELLLVRFPKEEFTDDRIKDYMKELCNLVAGKLKTKLGNAELKMGQSLPIGLIGYNEIFFRKESDKYYFGFEVDLSGHKVLCSISVEYTDDDVLQSIAEADLLAEEESEDVAFL